MQDYRDLDTIKFGEHLIFDGYGCNPTKLSDYTHCYDVMIKASELAHMRILTQPYLVKAESNETLGGKDPGGISGFMMIHESHMSIHTFVLRGFVTIDLYTCKEFDIKPVISFLKQAFEARDFDIVKMDRGLKYPKENIY